MLAKSIDLIKNQISYISYRIASSHHDTGKQKQIVLEFEALLKDLLLLEKHEITQGFLSVSDFLSSTSSKITLATSQRKPSDQEKSGDLLPEDLEGLPPEILDKLGLKESDKQELLIIEILKDLGGAACLSKIFVEMYKRSGDAPERLALGAKLYRMASKDQIKSSNKGKGWYCLPTHSTVSHEVQEEDK